MKKHRSFNILLWALTFAPLAVALAVYPRLPSEIPTNWNFSGEADAFGPRYTIFYGAVLTVGLQLLMAALPKIDPRGGNYARFGAAYRAMRLVLALFGLGVTVVQAASAFPGAKLDATGLVTAGTGILLAMIGNYLPKIRPNYMCGIRTPWTLASENVWRRTHRLAGPFWVAGGATLAPSGPLARGAVLGFLTGLSCALLAVPVAASYFYFRAAQKTENDKNFTK